MKLKSPILSSPRRSLRRMMVALTLSTSVVALPALADPATSTKSSEQLRYRQAVDAYREKKWDVARRLLLELWQESRTYDVAATLGQTEYQLGHYAAAANYLQFVIANIPPSEKLGTEDQFKKNLASLDARTARLSIVTDQPSAAIVIDGESVGTSPLPSVVYVEAGPHKIEAKLGERTAAQSIDVALGSLTPVELQLGAASASPAVSGAAAGSGLNEQPPANEQSQPSKARTIAVWSGLGVTAIATGVGIVFALKGASAKKDADHAGASLGTDTCPSVEHSATCAAIDSSLSDRESANQVANVSFVVAGVAAVATATMFFVWPRRHAETAGHLQITPIATRNTGGLLIDATF